MIKSKLKKDVIMVSSTHAGMFSGFGFSPMGISILGDGGSPVLLDTSNCGTAFINSSP